jgi:hypothetical protein
MGNRKSKRERYLKKLREENDQVLVRTWDELKGCKSETHYLEIEDCCGWIHSNTDKSFNKYLSTHTFYGGTNEYSTKILQKCGFNIIVDNWDK